MTVPIIGSLDDIGAAVWDEFVERHGDGSFFHLAGWAEFCARTYGFAPHYLTAMRGGTLAGVLPLVLVDRPIVGRALLSSPFCVYGGALALDDVVAGTLEDSAVAIARELAVDYIELRNRGRLRDGWATRSGFATYRRTIVADADANMAAIPRKQRAVVRKGLDAGLRATIDTDVGRFYRLYARTARDHGSPAYPIRHFEGLQEIFGARCEISVVERDGRDVCGVMSFYFRDEVLPYYAGGLPETRGYGGHDFMYWDVMRRAGERGVGIFDFGRSYQGTGASAFKKNWGFEATPLSYQCLAVGARAAPDVNPTNPRYRAAIALWKRLPLPLANRLGAWLSPGLC